MTAIGTLPDSWQEVCLIGIIPDGGSEIQFAGFTEDITDITWGDKDIEGLTLVNGGKIAKFSAIGDENITLKVHQTRVDANLTESVEQLFNAQSTDDALQPILVDNTLTRQKVGVILLWSETLPATAGALPAESKTALRVQIINAYMTVNKWSYDDKMLTAEVTLKWTFLQKDATTNRRVESTSGSAQLPAAITSATSF